MQSLAYRKLGTGPPIIILHGLFGASDNWLSIAKKLASEYTVYLVDQRNHGDSFHSDEFNYDVMASDLYHFIINNKIDKPYIIGHSMGGKTAMNFTVKYPKHVKGLIVVDIAPKAYPVHHHIILEALTSLLLENIKTRQEAEKHLKKYISEKGIYQFLLKNLQRKESHFYWKINLDSIKKNIENVGEKLKDSSKINTPTLFIRGENSNYILKEDYEHIREIFIQSKIVTIKDAGHWVHAEQPSVFFKIISYWLQRN